MHRGLLISILICLVMILALLAVDSPFVQAQYAKYQTQQANDKHLRTCAILREVPEIRFAWDPAYVQECFINPRWNP